MEIRSIEFLASVTGGLKDCYSSKNNAERIEMIIVIVCGLRHDPRMAITSGSKMLDLTRKCLLQRLFHG